jgi:hypothetical protein
MGEMNSYLAKKGGFIDKEDKSKELAKFVWNFFRIVVQCNGK